MGFRPVGVTYVIVASGKLLAFVPITRIFPHATDISAGPIALNNRGTAALVVNSASPERGTVVVLSTRRLRVRSRIRSVPTRTGLAIDRNRNTTYVSNFQDDTASFLPPGIARACPAAKRPVGAAGAPAPGSSGATAMEPRSGSASAR
jgi:hypothetical protein